MATLLLRLVCVLLVPRVLGVFELSITIDGQSRALRWAAGTGETAATAFAARHGLVDAAQVAAIIAAARDVERAGRDAPETNATGKRFGCAPDCAVDVDEVPGVTDAAWDLWRTPSLGGLGGYDVSYVRSRADLSTGGGNRFGYDLVRYAYNWFVRDGLGAPSPRGRRCCEFCAGAGFIGFSLLAAGVCETLALVEVNPAAVAAARATVAANGLGGVVDVFHSDGLTGVPRSELGTWDLVVSNPPHFVSVASMRGHRDAVATNWENNVMAVDTDWNLHRRFFADVGQFLAQGGHVVLQENHAGSAPEDLLPLVKGSGLRLAAIASHAVHENDFGPSHLWYLHLAKDATAWHRLPRNRGDGVCGVAAAADGSLALVPPGCARHDATVHASAAADG